MLQRGDLPLHCAAANSSSVDVFMAVLGAYEEGIRTADNVSDVYVEEGACVRRYVRVCEIDKGRNGCRMETGGRARTHT